MKDSEDFLENYSLFSQNFLENSNVKLPQYHELHPNINSDMISSNSDCITNIANKFFRNYSLLKCNLLQIPNDNVKSYHALNSPLEVHKRVKPSNRDNITTKSRPKSRRSLLKKTGRKMRFKYMMFTTEEKQFCTNLVTICNYDAVDVANCCQVPLKSLKRWIKVGSKRKVGGGRKVEDPELEGKLLLWIKDSVSKGIKLKYSTIKEKALKLTKSKNFMASKGWFEKFKKKYDLNSGRNNLNYNSRIEEN